jgi:hypothetical protein
VLTRLCDDVPDVIPWGLGLLMGITMAALRIRKDYSPFDLRQQTARERDPTAILRLLAIANGFCRKLEV